MGERGEAARPLDRKRQREQGQRRGQARPDSEGEHVDLADALRQHVAGAPERSRQNDEQKRPEARSGEPFGTDDGHADKSDRGADDLGATRPFAKMIQASRMVKNTCAMMTSDESPTGKPSWMAMNSRPNWPTPIRSP